MTNAFKLTITFLMLTLTACMVVVDPRLLREPFPATDTVIKEPSAAETALVLCEQFKLPSFRPMPAMPAMSDDQLKDPEVVEGILIDYIGDLRSHTRSEKQRIAQAYLDWKQKCEARGVKLD